MEYPVPSLENRKHQRVEFLRVPVDREQVPVWLFKGPDQESGIAGLIVNVSDGGVKVLTCATHPMTFTACRMDLMLGEDEGVTPFSGRLRRVWTSPFSKFGNVNGFEFLERSPLAEFVMQAKPDPMRRSWVRCLMTDLS